jgi:hypothetical protein
MIRAAAVFLYSCIALECASAAQLDELLAMWAKRDCEDFRVFVMHTS